jgi:UDP-N-acetylglucosamine 2-epimerase
VTNQKDLGIKGFKNLLSSLKKLKNTYLIFTGSNADPGGLRINQLIKSYVKKNKKNSIFIHNLGQKVFHKVLKKVDCIIGNSSSGVIEAPSCNTPSINIGKRQAGRIMCKSVINIKENCKEMDNSIKEIYKNNFLRLIKNQKKYYEKKNTSNKIIRVLEQFDTRTINLKKFYDMKL